MWLSVDPMSDKYPSISPYSYCAWNPVKLVDPDGRTVWIESGDGTRTEYSPNMQATGDDFTKKQISTLNQIYGTDLGQELLDVLIDSESDYDIAEAPRNQQGTYATVGNKSGNGAKIKSDKDIEAKYLAHELFHAFQFDCGEGGPTVKNEIEAYVFEQAIVASLQEVGYSITSAFLAKDGNAKEGVAFEQAMNTLLYGTTFSQSAFDKAVHSFRSQSLRCDSGEYSNYKLGNSQKNPLLPSFYPLMR